MTAGLPRKMAGHTARHTYPPGYTIGEHAMTHPTELAQIRPATIAELHDIIDIQAWVNSLMHGAEYHEPDPDYLSRSLMYQTLTATTTAEFLSQAGSRKLQEAVTDTPGAS